MPKYRVRIVLNKYIDFDYSFTQKQIQTKIEELKEEITDEPVYFNKEDIESFTIKKVEDNDALQKENKRLRQQCKNNE